METATRLVHQAREQFLDTGALGHDLSVAVRPDILTSWRRSRLSGASSAVDGLPPGTGVNTDTPLRRAAEPVLVRLAQQLAGLQAGVLLADRYARILGRWTPQTNILGKMDRIHSDIGSTGSEELIGTNGIGTIVEERRPHLVTGPEHYAEVLSTFTCVGAPIFNPLTRKFEGVVTMNCDASEASPLFTSLIAATAKEVEGRLLDLSSRRERALLDAFLLGQRAGRAIAVISDDVLLAGPHATAALRSLDQATVWQQLQDTVTRQFGHGLVIVPTHDGDPLPLDCTPIWLDEKLIGAIVETNESLSAGHPLAQASAAPVTAHWATSTVPGRSRAWQTVLARASDHRDSAVPMMVVGEAGTGKLALLRALFDGHPMTVFDCFSADSPDAGWVAEIGRDVGADGLIVLRHIDALSPSAAAALSARLDVLAADTESPRIVGTAHTRSEVASAGVQRLFDQLSVVTLELPPLRDRPEDIPDLLKQLNARHAGLTPIKFTVAAMRALARAPWPGNVRQLENVVKGIAATGTAREVTPELLPDYLGTYSTGRNLTKMEQLEMNAILETIAAANGNKVEMAKLLGISRSTLYRKMRYFRIEIDHVA